MKTPQIEPAWKTGVYTGKAVVTKQAVPVLSKRAWIVKVARDLKLDGQIIHQTGFYTGPYSALVSDPTKAPRYTRAGAKRIVRRLVDNGLYPKAGTFHEEQGSPLFWL